jgi:hypothetical protein
LQRSLTRERRRIVGERKDDAFGVALAREPQRRRDERTAPANESRPAPLERTRERGDRTAIRDGTALVTTKAFYCLLVEDERRNDRPVASRRREAGMIFEP